MLRASKQAAGPAAGALARSAPPRRARAPLGTGVSAERLEEFVRAEQHYFAQQRAAQALEPLSFQHLVDRSSSTEQIVELLREELPVRFAARISHIRKMAGWKTVPELVQLHDMHVKSFRDLRLAEILGDPFSADTVKTVRNRHKQIVPLFAEAVTMLGRMPAPLNSREPKHSTPRYQTPGEQSENPRDEQALRCWTDRFLTSRTSTEVLMTHCISSLEDASSIQSQSSTRIGILDRQCDPYEVCRQAAARVQEGPFPCLVHVHPPPKKIELCQTPRYLFYIVDELLQNSARNTVAMASREPVNVIVCADEHHLVIRISDRAGGMSFEQAENLWALRTSSTSSFSPKVSVAEHKYPWGKFDGNPLSGRGMGLNMCRLYAQYLGGSIEIMNLPGLGLDAYLKLRRVDA